MSRHERFETRLILALDLFQGHTTEVKYHQCHNLKAIDLVKSDTKPEWVGTSDKLGQEDVCSRATKCEEADMIFTDGQVLRAHSRRLGAGARARCDTSTSVREEAKLGQVAPVGRREI